MKKPVIAILLTILAVSFAPKSGHGQRLSLPAINIAQGKKIEATSTCGEDVSEQELFCKLATVAGKFEILGLSCDHCDPSVSSKNHSIMHAIDGTEKWWQSPPLSRGLQYQRVNITIDLGQVRFHLSPRPRRLRSFASLFSLHVFRSKVIQYTEISTFQGVSNISVSHFSNPGN